MECGVRHPKSWKPIISSVISVPREEDALLSAEVVGLAITLQTRVAVAKRGVCASPDAVVFAQGPQLV